MSCLTRLPGDGRNTRYTVALDSAKTRPGSG